MAACASPLLLRADGQRFTLADQLAQERQEPAERVVMHVMRAAQQGDLPLYAWTLGLPQAELLAMLHTLFPELSPLQALPEPHYRLLQAQVPPRKHRLARCLQACAAPDADPVHSEALARALAMVSAGESELWQDAGIASPQALLALLQAHFPGLPLAGQLPDKAWLWRWLDQPA